MKKLNTLLALSLIVLQLSGQALEKSAFKPSLWEIGWVSNDIFIGAFSTDVAMGFFENQAIGIRTTITNDYFLNNFEGFYDGANFVYRGGIFHKIYLPLRRDRQLILRHGPRISVSEYSLQTEGWVSFENFGNTQYRLSAIDVVDQNIELGYELILGLQQHYNRLFFLEYYVGLTYMDLVSTNSTQYSLSELRESNNYYYYPDVFPNNIRLVFGFVIGLKWEP